MVLRDIPEEIVEQYELNDLASDGWLYIQIEKGMPGLKKAAKIANNKLKVRMCKHGYVPCKRTPTLWRYNTCPTIFKLVMENFGIKYESLKDA